MNKRQTKIERKFDRIYIYLIQNRHSINLIYLPLSFSFSHDNSIQQSKLRDSYIYVHLYF